MADSSEVALGPLHGLQQLLTPDAEPLRSGDPVPPLWHWVALAGWTDPGRTGPDGHPHRDERLADTPVRRMFAGGEVVLGARPLYVGETVQVTTDLAEVTAKSGRSGDFTLARFESQVTDASGDVLMTERQDVVYTAPRRRDRTAPTGALPVVGRPLLDLCDGQAELRTDPTILLRFSGLTANPHRIHYDLDYAREVEGLPGLLVHGPLINLALAGLVAGPAVRGLRRVEHRNLSPLFVGETARLAARSDDGVVTAEATNPDGRPVSRVVLETGESL